MNEITTLNYKTMEYEILTDDHTISFFTKEGRFDVSFNEDGDGGLYIYSIPAGLNRSLSLVPVSSNTVKIKFDE